MSKKFIWKEEYGVGVKEIDEQHQNFFAIANNICASADSDNLSKQAVLVALSKLGNYALYHFSTEEEYFVRCKYDGADEHIAEHHVFRKVVAERIDRLKNETDENVVYALMEEVVPFIVSWMKNHILRVDKLYEENFHKCGLK